MNKINICIGRFQPFTQGHLNMVLEGELPCLVYRINSSKSDEDLKKIKVHNKVVKKDSIKNVIDYLDNNGEGELNETEKEVLKRPFTNELIEKEMELVMKANKKYFVDVIYVANAYEAIADFNSKVAAGEYEPNYLMCGDDRVDNYNALINKHSTYKTKDGEEAENVLNGKLTVNIGKGRTEGVSGTAVRKSIIKNDKSAFSKIMPKGTDKLFDEFVDAFNKFKDILKGTVNEYSNVVSLKDFIINSAVSATLYEASILDIEGTFKEGDEYIKHMEDLEKEFKTLQKMEWTDWEDALSERHYTWNCPNFIKYCFGNTKADNIIFAGTVYNNYRKWNVDLELHLYSSTKKVGVNMYFGMRPNSKLYTTEGNAIKDVIKSIKDTFNIKQIEYLKKQIVDRTPLISMFENKTVTDLKDFILEHLNERYIVEGGASGHMSHPFEYTEFTGNELLELVSDLFSGKIENMKEKLDGTNLHATMNDKGQVVFIRNKSNLNSELGGMSIQDMADKWADKPSVQNTFLTAGKIITDIFMKLGKKYFNPDSETRKVINCECIIAGKTNVMPYAADRVAFHGYKIYKKNDAGVWEEAESVEGHVEDIYKAAEGLSSAKPRANLIIKSVERANKFSKEFQHKIEKLFKDEGLDLNSSIEDWKRRRFNSVKPEWLDKEVDKVFDRWFNGDKSFKATELKKLYPEHYDEIKSDKFAKEYINKVMEPIDELFLSIGNELINLCDGFTNSEFHTEIVDILKKDIEEVVKQIEKEGSDEVKGKLEFQLNRLKKLGENSLNSAEGIVFTYKGKLMKLTGSFSALNQILGSIKFN